MLLPKIQYNENNLLCTQWDVLIETRLLGNASLLVVIKMKMLAQKLRDIGSISQLFATVTPLLF